jgi:mRNA interferase MazF
MKRALPIFRRGDIVRVPFPFIETNQRRRRPGLIVSDGILAGPFDLVWVAMITGASHERWPDDVDVGPSHAAFGLPIPCLIRVAKIAAITTDQASLVGHLEQSITDQAMAKIARILKHDDRPISQ